MLKKHQLVYDYLKYNKGTKISQDQIANAMIVGYHEKHEKDTKAAKMTSTRRQVRQIIRDLRVIENLPILSDRKGYWLSTDRSEITEWLCDWEAKADASAKSFRETGESMEYFLNMQPMEQSSFL